MPKTIEKNYLFGVEVVGDGDYWGRGQHDDNLYFVHFGDYCNVGGGITLGVFGRNEQDAIDEVIDYCGDVYPHMMMEDEHIAELRRDAVKQGYDEDEFLSEEAICGGNAGEWLYIGYGMSIEKF
jgi:hypothetical protein